MASLDSQTTTSRTSLATAEPIPVPPPVMRTAQDLAGVWHVAQARVQRIAAANEALDGLLAAVAERANELLVTSQLEGLLEDREGAEVAEESPRSRSN